MKRYKNGISRGQIAIDKFLCACQKGNDAVICQLFSSKEVYPDAISEAGKTALTLAILQKNHSAVAILLRYGSDINKTSHVYYHRDPSSSNMCSYDESPLNTATRLNYSTISKLLIEKGAMVNVQSECRPPQGVETVKDRTALHFAADRGNVEIVSCLVKHGAAVNICDKQQETALHLAVRCRHSLCESQREVVCILLEYGSLPNVANKSLQVPLYLAAFYGCVHKARILIEGGADINISCNSVYVTALHVAASKNLVHLSKLLIENGAKMNITNVLNYAPLQLNLLSQSKSSIAALLILHGTTPTYASVDHNGFTLMATLIHNMRLDCEILARLLVYSGYDLAHDLWILPEHLRENWLDNSIVDQENPHDGQSVSDEAVSSVVRVPDVHIPHGRVKRLCNWLYERQTSTASLLEICRVTIRSYLSRDVTEGSSIIYAVEQLPLPRSLIYYLLLKDVCDMSEI